MPYVADCSPYDAAVDSKKEITATFRPEYTILKYTLSDGSVKSKKVDTAEFCKALGDKNVSYITYLPPSCRGVNIKGKIHAYLFIYSPSIKKSFLVWNGREDENVYKENIPTADDCSAIGIPENKASSYRVFNVPYPALAVFTLVRYNNDNAKESYSLYDQYIYAIKNHNVPLKDMELCRYPFTNVFEEGRCCLGHDYANTVYSIDGLLYYPSLVFNGIGNHDLTCMRGEHFDNSNYSNKPLGKINSEYELMAKLHNKNAFPIEYLRNEHCTVIGRFNNILQNR